jgi:hypothetical protein
MTPTTEQPPPELVRRPRTNPVLTEDSRIGDAVVCRETVLTSPVGPLERGAVVHKNDIRVHDAPSSFVPLIAKVEGGLALR